MNSSQTKELLQPEANDESSAATDEKSAANVSEEKVDSSEEENLSLKLVDEISELSKL